MNPQTVNWVEWKWTFRNWNVRFCRHAKTTKHTNISLSNVLSLSEAVNTYASIWIPINSTHRRSAFNGNDYRCWIAHEIDDKSSLICQFILLRSVLMCWHICVMSRRFRLFFFLIDFDLYLSLSPCVYGNHKLSECEIIFYFPSNSRHSMLSASSTKTFKIIIVVCSTAGSATL